MYYHFDGIVQKYELIKIHRHDSFAMKWEKIWRFNDVVKLYDITTLDREEIGVKKPFIVPASIVVHIVVKT